MKVLLSSQCKVMFQNALSQCLSCLCLLAYRKDFRKAFREVGAVRSLNPTATNVLACTATATRAIYTEVAEVLSMDHPHVIAISPERPNIMYSVLPKKDLDEIADTVCFKLSSVSSPLHFPKTIIFCQRYISKTIVYGLSM